MSVMNQRPEKAVFEEVALALPGITESFVEKDWFVVQVIKVIAEIQYESFEVIFSGGTALSKAHGLLKRFSEDIDFRVLVPAASQNRRALSDYKHLVIDTLRKKGFIIQEHQVQARDQNRFFSIELDYESYFPRQDSIRPHILLELTAKHTQLPHLYKSVSSFVNTLTKQSPEVARIGSIDPVESAADKLSALAWRIPDRIRGGEYDDPSVVRHIHDLAILKDYALSNASFSKLLAGSMSHDDERAKNDTSLNGLPMADKLKRMFAVLESDTQYPGEYDRFVKGVSYAPEKEIPDFIAAIEAVKSLVNSLKA